MELGKSVEEIAHAVGGTVEGDGARRIRGVASLEAAEIDQIAFLANRRYVRAFRASRAGCVLLDPKEPAEGRTVIRCADPYLAFAKTLELFHPPRPTPAGVHPFAVVEPDEHGATYVEGASVLAFAFVGAGARVGAGTVLHPHSYVGPGAIVGANCVLMAGAVVAEGCVVGDRAVLNPGAVIGGDGFGFAPTPRGHYKIPQTGRAVLGDDVEVGSNSTVDRAAMGDTTVKRGTKVDNLVQIGHGVTVGEHCLLISQAIIAGSATLGDGVVLAIKACVLGHLQIGSGTQVAAFGLVTSDTPPGARRGGIPAVDHHQWLEIAVESGKLPELARTVSRQRVEIAALRADLDRVLIELRRLSGTPEPT